MGPGSIWAVAVGSIIGWGCFIQGGLWTQRAGGPLPLFLGFLVGGLLMIVVGYSYSYMIAKFPVAGGEFAYAYKGFGRTASYICGWMLSLGYLSIVALNATALPPLTPRTFANSWATDGFSVMISDFPIFYPLLANFFYNSFISISSNRSSVLACSASIGSNRVAENKKICSERIFAFSMF